MEVNIYWTGHSVSTFTICRLSGLNFTLSCVMAFLSTLPDLIPEIIDGDNWDNLYRIIHKPWTQYQGFKLYLFILFVSLPVDAGTRGCEDSLWSVTNREAG